MKSCLILVVNPRSSNFSCVKTEVINKINKSDFKDVKTYEIESTSPIENAKKIAKLINDGDKILAAGGDGTCHIATMAMIFSKKQAEIAYTGFGNFNDYANSFTKRTPEQTIELLKTGRSKHKITPVRVIVNGDFYSYATLYATAGITAKIAGIFEKPEIRNKLKKIKSRNLANLFSLVEAAKFYFSARKNSNLNINQIKINHKPTKNQKRITDIVVLNGPRMARVVRSKYNRQNRSDFGFKLLDSSRILKSSPFLVKSLFGYAPLLRAKNVEIKFKNPAELTLQIEGEAKTLNNVSSLEFIIEDRAINILQ